MTKRPLKYAARLSHVCEVSLRGAADLAYWRERLREQRLEPIPDDDERAQILLIGAEMRFKGVRFREVSVSVIVRTLDMAPPIEGAWLAQAYNSVRFFAFVERFFFQTPYLHAAVQVQLESPVRIAVGGSPFIIQASAAIGPSPAESIVDGGWSGPVFLPMAPSTRAPGKAFVAEIRGATQRHLFDSERQTLELRPGPNDCAARQLLESHFVGREWQIRADARHAKSKTYRRDELPGLAI